MTKICQTLLVMSLPLVGQAAEPIPFPTQGRVVVLGDSITYSGHYVALLEFYVRTAKPDSTLRILNLGLYGAWLLAQRGQGWSVVDMHGPMVAFLRGERLKDPNFLLAGDGVHANDQGHWLIAREILLAWGAPPEWAGQSNPDVLLGPDPKRRQALDLIRKRQRLLSDAWLTDVGHKRPGMATGKPLGQAQEEADRMDGEIEGLLISRIRYLPLRPEKPGRETTSTLQPPVTPA